MVFRQALWSIILISNRIRIQSDYKKLIKWQKKKKRTATEYEKNNISKDFSGS